PAGARLVQPQPQPQQMGQQHVQHGQPGQPAQCGTAGAAPGPQRQPIPPGQQPTTAMDTDIQQGGRVRRRGLAGARVRPHGAAVFPRRKCRVESQLEVFEVQRAGRVERHAAEPDWASWAPHGLLGRRREGPHRGRGQPDRDGHSWPTAPGSPGVPWYSCPRLLWRRGVRRHSVGWRRRGAPHALGWQYVHFQV
ncbi:unnamed protein product, partial [Prorocentrum cordatum]